MHYLMGWGGGGGTVDIALRSCAKSSINFAGTVEFIQMHGGVSILVHFFCVYATTHCIYTHFCCTWSSAPTAPI